MYKLSKLIKLIFFVTVMLFFVTGALLKSEKDKNFAYFFDCGGNYLKVDLSSGLVTDSGFLPQKTGSHVMLSRMRDGCLIYRAKYNCKKNILFLKVQKNIGFDDSEDLPKEDIGLTLPGFDLIEDFKQDDQDIWKGRDMKSRFYIDDRVMNRISQPPFSSAYFLVTPDQKKVLFAERKPDTTHGSKVHPPFLRIDWNNKMTLSSPQSLSGHFAIYDLVEDSLIAKYTIKGIRTDLQLRTLMNLDGSVIFHAHNDENGNRKLFEVRIKPALKVTEIEIGDFDPWWSIGIFANR